MSVLINLPLADVPALMARPADLGTWLERFAVAFAALSRATLAAPSETALDTARDEQLLSQWPWADPESVRGVALLAESRIDRETADAVAADYRRLFADSQRAVASPYESASRPAASPDRSVARSGTTAGVGAAYAAFAYAGTDDHIGQELDFLAALCVGGKAALDDGDDAALARLLDGAARFLDEHLLTFGPRVLHRVGDGARTYFYQGVAAMGLGCLAQAARAFRRA